MLKILFIQSKTLSEDNQIIIADKLHSLFLYKTLTGLFNFSAKANSYPTPKERPVHSAITTSHSFYLQYVLLIHLHFLFLYMILILYVIWHHLFIHG